jgi:hypothetical protein
LSRSSLLRSMIALSPRAYPLPCSTPPEPRLHLR